MKSACDPPILEAILINVRTASHLLALLQYLFSNKPTRPIKCGYFSETIKTYGRDLSNHGLAFKCGIQVQYFRNYFCQTLLKVRASHI